MKSMKFSDDEILEAVRESIADVLKIPLEDVKPDSVLTDDLEAVSIDFVDIMFRLESRFNVEFHAGNPLDQIAQSFEPGSLSRDGVLTYLGVVVVRQRIPEANASKVLAGMPVGNIQAIYTTSTWARAVKELLQARPDVCPSCGSESLEPVRLSVLICEACQKEIECPTQTEVLAAWATEAFSSCTRAKPVETSTPG